MIDTKELRIGNWVLHKGNITEVETINYSQINVSIYEPAMDGFGDRDKDLEGITLTEPILNQCGFKRTDPDCPYEFNNGVIGIFNFMTDEGDCAWHIAKFRYVHQFQNLYFSITGKELEIKL